MPDWLTRTVRFAGACFPLGVFAALVMVERSLVAAVTIAAVAVLGLYAMWTYLRVSSSVLPTEERIASVRRRGEGHLAYLAAFVVPPLALSCTTAYQVAGLGVFLATFGLVYTHSNMMFINPMLPVLGYDVYEVTFATGNVAVLVAAHRPAADDHVQVVELGGDIFLAVPMAKKPRVP